MILRDVLLREISLELFSPKEITGSSDPDHPLVVIEEAGHYLLVDGYKRFFALREKGEATARVIVKPWSRIQAKIERLRLNNPSRKTTLAEELEILQDLHRGEGLSLYAISRALGKKKTWAKRRIEILDRLAPDVAAILPDNIFRVTVAHGISNLPTDEQVPTALSIASAKLNLSEAIRCVKLLEVRDAPERAALREKPRDYLEASLGKGEKPFSGLDGLERVHELFEKALEDHTLDDPRKRKALLKALILKSQRALLALEVTQGEPTKVFGGMPKECIPVPSLFSNGGLDHDEAGDRRTGEEASGGRPEHPLDCLSLEARTKESQSDPQGEALFREEGVQKKDVSPGSFPKDSGSARQGELHGFPHSEKDPQGGLLGRLHHSPRTGADSPGPEPGEEALHALRNFTWGRMPTGLVPLQGPDRRKARRGADLQHDSMLEPLPVLPSVPRPEV